MYHGYDPHASCVYHGLNYGYNISTLWTYHECILNVIEAGQVVAKQQHLVKQKQISPND